MSVVIPAYNASSFIGEALDSVFRQTVPAGEVIVVNDGSPDTPELERVLGAYSGRILYLRQENKGASAARNTGIRAATQPLVAFLDSDDIWLPEFIATEVEMFRQDPSLALVYGDGVRFGDSPDAGKRLMEMLPSTGEVTFERLVRLECCVSTSTTMARREALLEAGLFDEGLPTCEDFDLWLRMVKRGCRIGYHCKVIMRSRLRAGSLSSNQEWMYRDFVRVLDKARQTLELTPAEQRAVSDQRRDYVARGQLYEGKQALQAGDVTRAVECLSEANEYLRTPKLKAVILLLKLAPWPVIWLLRTRGRHV